MALADHVLIRETCRSIAGLDGDAVEFGVYQGESLAVICDALPQSTIYGFDSFEGLPMPGPHDRLKKGTFGDTSAEEVRKRLGNRTNYRLIPGWFADTLPLVDISDLKFAHVDCDHYESYRQVLSWVWPRLIVGAKIIADDYGSDACRGAKMAIDEWVKEHRDTCSCVRTNTIRAVLTKKEAPDGNEH